jgi:hypothetical protein
MKLKIVLLLGLGLASLANAAGTTVAGLRCEYQTHPLAVESAKPRLSWTLASDTRGARQSAYQILVASSPQKLAADQGDRWDSGKVASDTTIQTEYAGAPLASGADCFWKVRAWDAADKPGAWSEPARWTMGLLKPDDWRATWIRAGFNNSISPWLRKTFTLAAAPERALAYVNAVGYFELYVNGHKVSADVLSPAVSDLKAHTLYVTYDLAPYLKAGTNCIGLWSGRGWATRAEPSGQRVQFQCRVPAGTGGAPVWIVSDESWKVAPSPYTTLGSQAWGKFGGERYDANLENPRWCAADFDDSAWANAQSAPATPARAKAQSCPPNRIGKVLPAVAVTPLAEGRYEIDCGESSNGAIAALGQIRERTRPRHSGSNPRHQT